ncbi:MAG TPA: acyl-CoA dehydrogenase [Gammaproteobacteria bacterium]|nr:acyl-CoA dehydrogenase [Gammaproteobacteria bacterium]
MDFDYSKKVVELQERLSTFMTREIYPNERTYEEQLESSADRWTLPPIMEALKVKARAANLWNLFLPKAHHAQGLTNLEYAPLCEIMGRSPIAPEVFNCSAPDTGNMEVLLRYGTKAHQDQWLVSLLAGEIRSGFGMTEPAVASSDATNIEGSIRREGNEYVINARKWWTSGAGDPRCKILIFMGKTDPTADRHQQQSMVLVPMNTPGITVLRPMSVFGYDDAPHGHMDVEFKDVRVPTENLLLGEGRGFEIAQGRLGPGRIHHCMRLIGVAERALEAMANRSTERVAFGQPLAEQGVVMEAIADSRIEIEQARLLVLKTAHLIDTVGARAARSEISMIKVAVPNMALTVLDRAIQVHGAAGVSQDFGLAYAWAYSRGLRLADGPDAVHRRTVARLELRRQDRLGWITQDDRFGH